MKKENNRTKRIIVPSSPLIDGTCSSPMFHNVASVRRNPQVKCSWTLSEIEFNDEHRAVLSEKRTYIKYIHKNKAPKNKAIHSKQVRLYMSSSQTGHNNDTGARNESFECIVGAFRDTRRVLTRGVEIASKDGEFLLAPRKRVRQ